MLAEAHPELAAQWRPTFKVGMTPDTACGSRRRVWWLCTAGQCGHSHVWEATDGTRVHEDSGCPVCAGEKPCQCRSLAAQFPDLVEQQWDYERNTVRPEELLPQSYQKVNWRCTHHDPPLFWTTIPQSRFRAWQPTGCPACARRQ